MFTAQDAQTIREALTRARPNKRPPCRLSGRRRPPSGGPDLQPVAYSNSVTLAQGARTVIGVGKVKTPSTPSLRAK